MGCVSTLFWGFQDSEGEKSRLALTTRTELDSS